MNEFGIKSMNFFKQIDLIVEEEKEKKRKGAKKSA